MRVLQARERRGGYDVGVAQAPAPSPAAGEVLVRVAASGVNRADLSQIAGSYPPPPGESAILGLEISGAREDTGERVCALLAGGGHAELAAVPAGQLFPAPASMALRDAAAIPEAFLTAFVNLAAEAGLAKGETLLVHAGASGVGLAAIQVGKLLGARVAAATRSPGKAAAIARAGADLTVITSERDLVAQVESAWGKNAVDVVLDPVGAATLAADLALAATGARIVLLATMGGSEAPLDIRRLMGKRARLIGSTLRSRPREEKARLVARFREEILPEFDRGRLAVAIDSVFPPERAGEAFARMRENRNAGKILIDWSREG